MGGDSVLDRVLGFFRAWPVALVAAALLAITFLSSEISAVIVLYGFGKLALAGYLGYWLDRWIFPYGRPHEQQGQDAEIFASIRRVLLVAACLVSAALMP